MAAAEEVSPKTMAAAEEVSEEEECAYLPEELLECIIKSLNSHSRTFKSLSVVSKQFLSITNCLRFSMTITDKTIPFIPHIFHRFPNLTSLNLTILSKTLEEVDDLLTLISTFPLDIKSLNLSNALSSKKRLKIPANGLISLSKTMKNLTSLTFYGMSGYKKTDLYLIAECFPLLQELNLNYPWLTRHWDFMVDDNDPLLPLPNLRKIDLSGIYITQHFMKFLYQNCKLLKEISR